MDIRDATDADLDAMLDVRRRSFGPVSVSQPQTWFDSARRSISNRSLLVGTHDGAVVAAARIRHFMQWWSGRSVPMAGIGGVVVAPEARGTGTASALMTAVVRRCHELGFPLTALFPATVGPYHAVGYELAGRRQMVDIPAESLRRLQTPALDLRRATIGDEHLLNRLTAAAHAARSDDGPFEIASYEWTSELADQDLFTYVVDDGFVSYRFDGHTLVVEAMAAVSRATTLGLWRLVGSGSSIARTVRATVGPHDPIHWLVPGQVEVAEADRFMLRLVDAGAAVAGRGFPTGPDVAIALRLTDDELPHNAGDFVLTVRGGSAQLVPGDGPNPIELGPRGLAAIYAGIPTATLRLLGLATGGSSTDDERLDAVFSADAFMVTFF